MIRVVLVCCLFLAVVGCSAGAKVRTVDLGLIKEVQYVGGGWGSPPLMQIRTEKETVLLDDLVSVPTNVHGHYDYYESGYRRFWWDGADFSYRTTRRTPVD